MVGVWNRKDEVTMEKEEDKGELRSGSGREREGRVYFL
jgi:hypothetical protein